MIRSIILTVVFLVPLAAIIIYLFAHLGFNRTDSVDFRFYWHKPIVKIERGKYYLINYAGPEYSGLITKKVACLPSDELVRVKNDFICNGEYIAKIIIEAAPNGKEYPQYYPNNSFKGYFVVGDSVNSYDSRYFGVLSAASFKREVIPLAF
jgi:conjugal transfer pilin signal peptidase TrbI